MYYLDPPSETLTCRLRVGRMLYPKTEFQPGGFAIVACSIIDIQDGLPYADNIVIKGKMFSANYGASYDFHGKYVKEEKYGESYQVISMTESYDMGSDEDREIYLQNIMTERQYSLLSASGLDVYTLAENGRADELAKVKGIGKKAAARIVDNFHARYAQRKVYNKLSQHGLELNDIISLLNYCPDPDRLLDMVLTNPYVMITNVKGIGWAKADKLAEKLGYTANDPRRVDAYVVHTFREWSNAGHTWCNPNALWSQVSNFFGTDDMSLLQESLRRLIADNILWSSEDKTQLGLRELRDMEENIAYHLHRIAQGQPRNPSLDVRSVARLVEAEQNWKFTEEQIAAVQSICDHNVSIVTGYGGCVDGETEFMSQHGWKKIRDYSPGDKVLQYLPNGCTELVDPEQYHRYPNAWFYHIKNLSGSIDQKVSAEHNVVYLTSKGNLAKISAVELYKRHQHCSFGFNGKFITTFRYDGQGIKLSDLEIRLMCAVICDGHFPSDKSARCRINIKKERKKERLRALLNQMGIEYKEYAHNPSDPEFRSFCFVAPMHTKVFSPDWYHCSYSQLQTIIDEILHWDGTIRPTGRRSFSTTVKQNADFVQFAFSSCGYRSTIHSAVHPEKTYEREYIVNITQRQNSTVSLIPRCVESKPSIDIVPASDGFKYCFTVPTHMFVIRHNDRICITGNTGKSSAVSLALKALNTQNFSQCALSGRAAARLTEVTGKEGVTIHRLLGYINGKFMHDEQSPLTDDIIILDEISMVGAELFLDLLKAIPTGTKLIMLGDDGQLESIGLCNIFKDMLDSGVIPVYRLTQIHRQAAKSAIITESMKVRQGVQLFPHGWVGMETRGEQQDLDLKVYSDYTLTSDTIIEQYKRLLSEGVSHHRIQIVVPMKSRGDACTLKLNKRVQDIVNADNAHTAVGIGQEKGKAPTYSLRLGDRVICVRNMYRAERPYPVIDEEDNESPDICPVYNGDRGVITQLSPEYMIVKFDLWGDIKIPRTDYINIELGYALSCHKLQGSEADYVIIGMDYVSRILLTREWVYTAITRAKKHCVIVAEGRALEYAISNSNIPLKQTFLTALLRETFSK